MSDKHLNTGASPEEVAFWLLKTVAAAEGRVFHKKDATPDAPAVDREWILSTYAQCLQCVQYKDVRPQQNFFGK